MRRYTLCNNCDKPIYLKKGYQTAFEVREHLGEILTLRCPHCGKIRHLPYTRILSESWGPWLAVGIPSAIILGAAALIALLQQAGAGTGAVIWIPLLAIVAHAGWQKVSRMPLNAATTHVDRCVRSATHDGYQLLLSLNLFNTQDDAVSHAYYTEPLLPLVAQYISKNIKQLL